MRGKAHIGECIKGKVCNRTGNYIFFWYRVTINDRHDLRDDAYGKTMYHPSDDWWQASVDVSHHRRYDAHWFMDLIDWRRFSFQFSIFFHPLTEFNFEMLGRISNPAACVCVSVCARCWINSSSSVWFEITHKLVHVNWHLKFKALMMIFVAYSFVAKTTTAKFSFKTLTLSN